MTDIVTRLRETAECADYILDRENAKEAADEIEQNRIDLEEYRLDVERLRAALENIQQARVLQAKEIVDAANEIESLRLALEVAANDLEDWGAYTKAKNARAALEGE